MGFRRSLWTAAYLLLALLPGPLAVRAAVYSPDAAGLVLLVAGIAFGAAGWIAVRRWLPTPSPSNDPPAMVRSILRAILFALGGELLLALGALALVDVLDHGDVSPEMPLVRFAALATLLLTGAGIASIGGFNALTRMGNLLLREARQRSSSP
jgi:hypothetical protein